MSLYNRFSILKDSENNPLIDESRNTNIFCNKSFNDCNYTVKSTIKGDILIFGDWGEMCNDHQDRTYKAIRKIIKNTELVISVGDNFYNVDEDDDLEKDKLDQHNNAMLYDTIGKGEVLSSVRSQLNSFRGKFKPLSTKQIRKYKALHLLDDMTDNGYNDYIKYHFRHSYLNCYKEMMDVQWYLCLGNHDVEPVKKYNKLAMYQICADHNNMKSDICQDYQLMESQPDNWNMPSFYWNVIHKNIQFIFLDTNILHFIEIFHFDFFISLFFDKLSAMYPKKQHILEMVLESIHDKSKYLYGELTDSVKYAYLKKRDKKFALYNNSDFFDIKRVEISNQLNWFIECLTNTQTPWNCIIGHHPPHFFPHKYSEGKKSSLMPSVCIISLLIELYNSVADNMVQAHFSGHVHNQQYMFNTHSLCNEIITGAGGTDRDITKKPEETMEYNREPMSLMSGVTLDYNNVFDQEHGFIKCNLDGPDMTINYYSSDTGKLISYTNINIDELLQIRDTRYPLFNPFSHKIYRALSHGF